MTFPESPKLAFVRYQPELMLHLASPEDRMAQLENLGVDYLYLIDFTSHFAGNTARDFFEKYVSRLRAKAVVAGFDYHFGSDRKESHELRDYFNGKIVRSEEHTSELQSPRDLVCRLLLEKKK